MLPTITTLVRKVLSRPLLAALATASLLGLHPVSAEAANIGVTMVPPEGFFGFLRDGIARHAKSLGDVDVAFQFADAGAGDTQVEQVKRFIASHVDALIVLPADASATQEITRLARAASTPLVFVNNGPNQDWFAGQVALAIPNDLVAGRLQMEKLAQLLGGKGKIVILRGPTGHSGAALRTQGVKEVLTRYPDIHVIEEAPANWDRNVAQTLMSQWLAKGDHIDAVAANNDEMALGAVQAVEAAHYPNGHIPIGGVDALPDAIKAIQADRMSFSVLQNADLEGSRALDDAISLLHHQPVQQYDWVPFELTTKQTLNHTPS